MASETDAAAYDTAEAHGVAGAGGVAADARAELERLRAPLAAAGLGLGVALASDPAARPAGPAEAAAAAGMIPDRRREFLAGRLAARRALRSVGLTCGDVPRAGRRPVFPPGYAASITHDAGLAVAVARPPGHTGPAGCDLELGGGPPGAARPGGGAGAGGGGGEPAPPRAPAPRPGGGHVRVRGRLRRWGGAVRMSHTHSKIGLWWG
ncbi:hypothetical protein [Streptomyces pseudogriseolus]|uniref:hypothetical protein n=1 Tax=Streptomyces pseudogriseolus TaxID=36817 RepID=UPI003675B051